MPQEDKTAPSAKGVVQAETEIAFIEPPPPDWAAGRRAHRWVPWRSAILYFRTIKAKPHSQFDPHVFLRTV